MALRHMAAILMGLCATPALGECGTPGATDAELIASARGAAAIDDALDRLANAEGRLWRIETTPPSYLVGTFHIAAGGIEDPGPVLTELVQNADELFLELDDPMLDATLADWAKDPATLFRGPDDRLSDTLTEAERVAAEALLARYGMPFVMADQMKPIFLVSLLALPPCAVDLAGKPGLDSALDRIAREAAVTVTALETMDEQLAAFGDDAEQDEMLRLMLTQARSYEDDWFLFLAMYRTEHVGAIWSLSVLTMIDALGAAVAEAEADVFWQRLVTARNVRMVERMLPGLRQGKRVVAVGALHLPGEDGIVELLRSNGLAVRRIGDGVGEPTDEAGSPAEPGLGVDQPPL